MSASVPDSDLDQIVYYERAGWEAYYDRNWTRAFWLLMRLSHAQFRMGWLTACAAAIDAVRASIAFAPLGKSDVPTATHHIEKFHAKAKRSLDLNADAHTLAVLEMDYWVVHRRLAIARALNPHAGDSEPLIQSFANLHAALFDSTLAAMRESAEWRARATATVDLITSNRSADVPGDWRKVEEYLRLAYRAVKQDR